MNAAGDITFELDRIRSKFLASMVEQIVEIGRLLSELGNCRSTCEVSERIRFLSHKLAGVSETLGFPRVGELAAACEDRALTYIQTKSASDREKLGAELELLLSEMEHAVDASDRRGPTTASAY